MTGCADHKIHFWDAASGESHGPPVGHRGSVSAATFAAGGRIVVSGSWDRTARMWDLATRRPIGPSIEHGDSVHAISISPTTSTFITGSLDGTAWVRQIPDQLPGDPSRIALWCEVITGMQLDDNDSVRVLDSTTWNVRRRELESLGGAPLW